MHLQFTAEEQAFRDEVRGFLRDNLPDHIREQVVRSPSYVSSDDTRAWHRIVYERGWAAPNWPAEHGGPGWTATQKYIFEEEYQAARCPRLSPFGLTMVGPVIYTFGTPEQKERYLEPILSGETLWCQGYSEPGSGSDLASLQTRAVQDGDHYVVNGQKIWTSHAHHADMIFCLVRTDTQSKPQQGISFLLIDMASPGIEVRPIISMDGGHYLNEVFFNDVRVPVENRIGEENKGWTYAKFLLGNERTGIAGVGRSKIKVRQLKDIIAAHGKLGGDTTLPSRLAAVDARLTALEHTQLRMLSAEEAGHKPGAEASMLKIAGTEIEQELNELLVEALDYYALPYDLTMLRADANIDSVVPDHGIGLMTEHLLRRAASIYGGTNEIQRNILAKAVLQL